MFVHYLRTQEPLKLGTRPDTPGIYGGFWDTETDREINSEKYGTIRLEPDE